MPGGGPEEGGQGPGCVGAGGLAQMSTSAFNLASMAPGNLAQALRPSAQLSRQALAEGNSPTDGLWAQRVPREPGVSRET